MCLKTHLIKIHSKYETLIDCEDKQHFRLLSLRLDQLSDKQTDQTNESQEVRQTRGQKKRQISREVVKREDNDLTDKVVTNEDSDERKTSTTDTDLKSIKDKTCYERLNRKPNRVFKVKAIHCDYKDCDYKCRSDANLASHMKSHDNQKTEAYRQQRLSLHRRCYDLVTNSYICDDIDCGKSFKNYRRLRGHIISAHSSRDIRCDYTDCHKLFKTRDTMKAHFKYVHNNDKPFKCPHNDCDRGFASNGHLDQHVASHSSERLFVCDFNGCAKSFKTQQLLWVHKRIHSAEPVIRCRVDGCAQRFRTQNGLQKHRVIDHHFKPKVPYKRPIGRQYPCQWPGCDFTAALNHSLKLHQRRHTGDRPLVCDWPECGKRFARPTSLRDHKNIHNNLKPHACHWPGCQYRCASSANISKHWTRGSNRYPNPWLKGITGVDPYQWSKQWTPVLALKCRLKHRSQWSTQPITCLTAIGSYQGSAKTAVESEAQRVPHGKTHDIQTLLPSGVKRYASPKMTPDSQTLVATEWMSASTGEDSRHSDTSLVGSEAIRVPKDDSRHDWTVGDRRSSAQCLWRSIAATVVVDSSAVTHDRLCTRDH
ncbi:unnamed protein product, partial [Medioppia subpectinata]